MPRQYVTIEQWNITGFVVKVTYCVFKFEVKEVLL